MLEPKNRIHFIFSHTQFASNLGSAVRVMKNMGFSQLVLIQPECDVGAEARTMAMGGAEILDQATFFPSLEVAAKHLDILIGTSARFGSESSRWITPRMMTAQVLAKFPESNIGIAFGSEGNGLKKEEIQHCQWLTQIPTGSSYRVINLAQSVAIVAYELHLGLSDSRARTRSVSTSKDSLDSLFKEITRRLKTVKNPPPIPVQRITDRLHRLAARAELDPDDVKMLRALIKTLGSEE
jgi:TrmH family RNA methyltransferase